MNKALSTNIQSNHIVKQVFSLAKGCEVYLVGGFIRDLAASGRQSKDIDFVVNNNHNVFAGNVARALGGKSIDLKKELLARVVLKDQITIDFTPMQGDICSDLMTRDFTMNAIAWSPSTDIIDITGGLKDIESRRISAIDRENFVRDPLRILRAYRFFSELGWMITPRTRRLLQGLLSGLDSVAHERITLELIRILCSQTVNRALKTALRDGVLGVIIDNDYYGLHKNTKLISRILGKVHKLPELDLATDMPQGLTYTGLLCLEALLLDAKGHKLSLSREAAIRISLSARMFDRYAKLNKQDMRDKKLIFDLFKSSGSVAHDMIILSNNLDLISELRLFQRIDKSPLLTAGNIMKLIAIDEGPLVGRYLDNLKELEFKGELTSVADAERWVRYQHAI